VVEVKTITDLYNYMNSALGSLCGECENWCLGCREDVEMKDVSFKLHEGYAWYHYDMTCPKFVKKRFRKDDY